MSKISKILILFLSISNCSLDNKSGIWTNEKKNKLIDDKKVEIFKDKKKQSIEFNKDLKIVLKKAPKNKTLLTNDNNTGVRSYTGKLKKSLKYNFSKIKRFDEFEPELTFYKDKIFFFDNKGSLLKFDLDLNSIWKKNYYLKSEKKLKPIIYMAAYNNILIVADSISKLYAINVKNGDILWTVQGESPFNSQVKIYNDKVFVVDFENTLSCYSLTDGKKNWIFTTEKSFINSNGDVSIAIKNDKIFFNNSIGDITALDTNSGRLIWQISSQNSLLFEDIINLKNSTLVAGDNSILFSNNKNSFYSLDQESGKINWKQKINSNLKPVLIENLIITVSLDGYLFYIDNNTGNIIKIISIFNQLSKKLKKTITPTGFALTHTDIFITTSNGRLIKVDIKTGIINKILKIDNNKISKPFIYNKNIFVIKNRSVIKFNE